MTGVPLPVDGTGTNMLETVLENNTVLLGEIFWLSTMLELGELLNGSAVLELLESQGLLQTVEVRLVGFPDRLIEHGAPSILKELYGLTSSHIKDEVLKLVRAESKGYELAH